MKIPLQGGAYSSRSVIANAQRCINLYEEKNPPDSPQPFTYYPTPGLTLLATAPNNEPIRAGSPYRTSHGDLYVVAGSVVYYVSPLWVFTQIGTLTTISGPVSFADNGIAIVLVDGTTNGYAIDMLTRDFAAINSPFFYGSIKADYIDSFFLFFIMGTNGWYSSLSEQSFLQLTAATGALITGNISAAGTAYTNGQYNNVALTGGTGMGARANITVLGNVVTNVVVIAGGINYVLGDVLSATAGSIGGTGSGFTFNVDTVGGQAFDGLYFQDKTGYPDPISSLIVMHREIWLVGQLTTEVWYNAGAANFPFQIEAGVFIEHGCIAPYSLAAQSLNTFWLSQDKQGNRIVLKGASYQAEKISTYAMEAEFATYSTVSDAVGFTYQIEGHSFYVLVFPTADKTWVMDIDTVAWHEWNWVDNNGNLHRTRLNGIANVYGISVGGDWQNGNLYQVDINNYTDNGIPIPRIRSFPHLLNELKRVSYDNFIADMECGSDLAPADAPVVSLRYSDDRGRTYSNKLEQPLGNTGGYSSILQWPRLGLARDKVFELSWSSAAKTALQGAYIETTAAET
jgi:hypothetical protein